jgi:hypothetical protein
MQRDDGDPKDRPLGLYGASLFSTSFRQKKKGQAVKQQPTPSYPIAALH